MPQNTKKEQKEHLFSNKRGDIIDSVETEKMTGTMRDMDNNAHSVFLLYYHLIMVTRYRRKVFDEQISARGKEIFEYGVKEKNDQVGVVTGLAYTSFGGDVLSIEVNYFEGTGGLPFCENSDTESHTERRRCCWRRSFLQADAARPETGRRKIPRRTISGWMTMSRCPGNP